MNRFSTGFAIAFCVQGLIEDWFGLDGYIEFLRRHWITLPWWIWPIVIVTLLGSSWFADYLKTWEIRLERRKNELKRHKDRFGMNDLSL